MSRHLVIVGCGGFGREAHDVLEAMSITDPTWELVGYLDDNPSASNIDLVERRGSRVLGGTGWIESAPRELDYVVAIGAPAVRRAIDERFAALGRRSATLIHPHATIGTDVSLGDGTVVCAGVRVSTHVRIGRAVHLNANCTIGHDAVLGNFVSVNPLAAVSGEVNIGDQVLVGAQSVILQQLSVGSRSVVGAAACVVRNVPQDHVVKGVPAR